MSVSGGNDQLSVITDGVRRGYFNNAGITSTSNVYTSGGGSFRNYGSAWIGSTGVTGNGFSFINSVDGTAMTLSSTGNMVVTGTLSSGAITARADTDALFVKSITNQNAAEIAFSSQGPSTYAQIGRISYQHGDTQAYGGTDVFTIGTTETAPRILADGLLMFKSGLALKPASGTGAGTTLITSGRALQNITSINTSGTIDSSTINSTGVVYAGDTTGTSGGLVLAQRYSGNDNIATLGTMYSNGGWVLGYGAKAKNGASGFVSTFDNFNGAR